MALPGGYGGMVVAAGGRMTLACCMRRDALSACRVENGMRAGEAVERFLLTQCRGVREALTGAWRRGPWLAVGPLRPGAHRPAADGMFRVGNAAGESHPLTGEGIGMALQSATLLASELTREPGASISAHAAREIQARYSLAWRAAFSRRLGAAAVFAHIAMRPRFASGACALLARWPVLLTEAARIAGKSRAYSAGTLHQPAR